MAVVDGGDDPEFWAGQKRIAEAVRASAQLMAAAGWTFSTDEARSHGVMDSDGLDGQFTVTWRGNGYAAALADEATAALVCSLCGKSAGVGIRLRVTGNVVCGSCHHAAKVALRAQSRRLNDVRLAEARALVAELEESARVLRVKPWESGDAS